MTEKVASRLNRSEFVQGTLSGALPRSAGSWPGYRFTSPPLSLPAAGS